MGGYKFLKPVNPGAIVRDPLNKSILDMNGEYKPWVGKEGTYWRRRVMEGSCQIIDKTEEAKEKKVETVLFDEGGNVIKNKGARQ